MLDGLMNLPPLLSGGVIVVGTILLALGTHALMRRIFAVQGEEKNDLASPVVVRISALHALILALIFAQEFINLRDVSTSTSREAALVGDVFYDLGRYDAESTRPIREDLADYTRLVLDEEWPRLGATGQLYGPAWQAWESAYGRILDLRPDTPRQEELHEIMLRDIREISGLRRTRENAGLSNVHTIFMVAAVAGVVLTAAGFYPFAPTRQNLFLLSSFAGYTGLVIFFIAAFANPFTAPGQVDPAEFRLLYAGEMGTLARSP